MRSGNEVWNAWEGQLSIYSEPGLMNNRGLRRNSIIIYKQSTNSCSESQLLDVLTCPTSTNYHSIDKVEGALHLQLQL